MSEEKQIEEMAHALCGQEHSCGECDSDYRCEFILECSVLHRAGYRKQSEVIDDFDDLLIDFDEMGFCPTTLVPAPEGYAVEWKRKLVNALQGYRKQSEGEWVSCDVLPADEDGEWTMYACSVCKHTTDSYYRDVRDLSRYCPECGAKMKGV